MSRTFSEGWILIRADLPYSRHSPDALLNEKSASLKGFLKAAVSGHWNVQDYIHLSLHFSHLCSGLSAAARGSD